MPLPDYPPVIVQAPVRAGIGLRFGYQSRVAQPCWPVDWWQRDYDDPVEWDKTSVDGIVCMTERMMRVPEATR
jgi:hypothetical protein